jgi:tRNA modification GTPase
MRPTAAETDTIAAIATPLGEGGLAVLRVSGADALAVAGRVFVPAGRAATALAEVPTHTLHYGHAVRGGTRLDEVLVAVMRAPRTFTREDVVEFSCHGGVFVARQILEALLAAGARLAQPGEFTRRAFLHGRLDLTQAEAVADLIHARTELALSAANQQLAGGLSRRVRAVRDDLLKALAHLEAHIDFPDEDIAPDTREALLDRMRGGLASLDTLLATAREGRILRRGVRAAILGRPNAGKSSLLNQLLGHDRAIVSPVAGTTRDTIEETANIRGLPVVFVDTAGLREAADVLEEEGIRRTRAAAAQAEVLLHVLDTSEALDPVDQGFLAEFRARPRLLVLNKADLPARLVLPASPDSVAPPVAVAVSCTTGAGLDGLKDALFRLIGSGQVHAGTDEIAINARHEDALRRGREAAGQAADSLAADRSLELVALDLRLAITALGEVVGETTTDDLLDVIFREFCLGK